MANLFWISAAQVAKDLGDGPYSAATLLARYGWTFSRADGATCATYIDKTGLVQTAAANLLRLQYEDLNGDGIRETPGFSLEGSRTNVVLWNRDLTNAAWVKTGGGGVTAVKDQTGLDGVASSCSRITANGANGTCLQAITLGSSARAQSIYIKRLVGTGNIDMTMDNGSTWTTVLTGAAGATFTRVTIPTQTLANPTVGFRIVANGDSVAIDFVQNENGVFQSSPIATTTAAVTRAADSLTVPFVFGPQDLTVFARVARPVWADAAGTTVYTGLLGLGGAAVAKALDVGGLPATRQWSAVLRGTTATSRKDTNIAAGTSQILAVQLKNLTTTPALALDVNDGTGYSAFQTGATAFTGYADQILRVGARGDASTELYGVLLDLKARAGLITLAAMQTEPSFAPANPLEVTDFEVPGPLISKAQSGRVNTRGTQQIGRTWTERYLLRVSDTTSKEFLARMSTYWRNGTIFAHGHVDYAACKGVGGGVPLVNGASQTGSTLIVDQCPASTAGWLLAGDIFRVQGLPQVLMCAADVNTEGSGRALIPLVTPIFTGGSPADNASLTITGVTLDVVILEPPSFPTSSGHSADFGELVLKFSESL